MRCNKEKSKKDPYEKYLEITKKLYLKYER